MGSAIALNGALALVVVALLTCVVVCVLRAPADEAEERRDDGYGRCDDVRDLARAA